MEMFSNRNTGFFSMFIGFLYSLMIIAFVTDPLKPIGLCVCRMRIPPMEGVEIPSYVGIPRFVSPYAIRDY